MSTSLMFSYKAAIIFIAAVFTLVSTNETQTTWGSGNNKILSISKEMSMQNFLRATASFSTFYLGDDNGHHLDFFSTDIGRLFLNSSLRNDRVNPTIGNKTVKIHPLKLLIPYALINTDVSADSSPKSKRFQNLVKMVQQSDALEGALLTRTFTGCSSRVQQRLKELTDLTAFRKLVKSSNKNFKVGILYKLHSKHCRPQMDELRPLVGQSDIVVLDMRPPTTTYTYDEFKSFIEENIREVVAYLKKINSDVEIIYKFSLYHPNTYGKTSVDELVVLHALYAHKWSTGNNRRIILDLGIAHKMATEKFLRKLESSEKCRLNFQNQCPDLVSSLWRNKIKNSGVRMNFKENRDYTTAEVKTVLSIANETFGWMIVPNGIHILNEAIEFNKKGKVLPLVEEVNSIDLEYVGKDLLRPYIDANEKVPGIMRGIMFEFQSRTKLFSYLESGRAKRDTTSNTHYSQFVTFEEIAKVMNSSGMECGIAMRYQQLPKLLTAAGKSKVLKKSFKSIQFMVWKIDFGTIKFENEGTLQSVLEKLSDLRTSYQKRIPKLQVLLEVGWRKITSTPLTGGQCNAFLKFWETIFTWATIHHFEIIVADALSYGNDFGWWKILDNHDLSYKPTFAERLNGPCTKFSTTDDIIKRLDINKELVGITLKPTVRKNGYVFQKEFETMVTVVTNKFRTIELIWKSSSIKINQVPHGSEIYISAAFDFSSRPEMLQQLGELKLFVKTASKGSIKGIHFSAVSEGCHNLLTEMKWLIDHNKFPYLNIGVSMPSFRLDASSSRFHDLEKVLKTSYLSLVNYVIWNADTKAFALGIPNEFALPVLFEEQRKVRVSIQRVYPNVKQFISRFSWPGRDFEESTETTRNFLRFWSAVNELSTAYNTPYFIFQAFDVQVNESVTCKNGWWRIRSYSDLSNITVYEEKEAGYFNPIIMRLPDPVLKPVGSPPQNFPVWNGMVIAGPIIVMLLIVVAIQGIKNLRKPVFPSKTEVHEFAEESDSILSEESVNMKMEYNSTKYEIPKREFRFDNTSKEILGMGHYGIVYKLIVFRFSKDVAVKVPHSDCSKQTFKSLLSEIKIMSYVGDHENVVHFLGAYTKEISKGLVYIVTELCPMGSLHSHLQQLRNNDKRSFEELFRFCVEIALGMQYISEKGVIHGDLSARNVLLDANMKCKISDFGLSRKLYQYEIYVKNKQEELPWRWLAIESLKRFEFSIKSDVWSFGVTIWEIFSFGDIPYPGQVWDWEFVDKLAEGMRMKKPEAATEDIYKVLQNCWNNEPNQRPNFDELVTILQAARNDYTSRQYTKLCDAVST